MQPLCYYIGRTGENRMSKYCRPMGLYVTYMDCMECEDKECITKREGYIDNIVIRCNVRECSIRKNTTVYYLVKEKVVLGKRDIKPFVDCFSCENANIDTGYRGMQTDIYPVFTTKEKCIEWLKG